MKGRSTLCRDTRTGVSINDRRSSQLTSFFRMCFARNSLISRCLGTGCNTPDNGVVISIVIAAMSDQYASGVIQFADQIGPFHPRVSSETLRTPAISPLTRSAYRSRRFSWSCSSDSPCGEVIRELPRNSRSRIPSGLASGRNEQRSMAQLYSGTIKWEDLVLLAAGGEI